MNLHTIKETFKALWNYHWFVKLTIGVSCFDVILLPVLAIFNPELYNIMMTGATQGFTLLLFRFVLPTILAVIVFGSGLIILAGLREYRKRRQ